MLPPNEVNVTNFLFEKLFLFFLSMHFSQSYEAFRARDFSSVLKCSWEYFAGKSEVLNTCRNWKGKWFAQHSYIGIFGGIWLYLIVWNIIEWCFRDCYDFSMTTGRIGIQPTHYQHFIPYQQMHFLIKFLIVNSLGCYYFENDSKRK